MIDYQNLIDKLQPVVRNAGAEIMKIHARGVVSDHKRDGSPVTEADRAAERIILDALARIAPEIPVISEENSESHRLAPPDIFFLVDPLDGTKEFLKSDGKGSFTVNIALVENRVPTMGLVYAPALDRMFFGASGLPAREADGSGVRVICVRPAVITEKIAVASVSHRDAETDRWLAENGIKHTVSIGSSLKFCLVAAGEADVYPRFGPTMEWDTAAGDAVLRAAGGIVTNPDQSPFFYGKVDYRNGPFVAASAKW